MLPFEGLCAVVPVTWQPWLLYIVWVNVMDERQASQVAILMQPFALNVTHVPTGI